MRLLVIIFVASSLFASIGRAALRCSAAHQPIYVGSGFVVDVLPEAFERFGVAKPGYRTNMNVRDWSLIETGKSHLNLSQYVLRLNKEAVDVQVIQSRWKPGVSELYTAAVPHAEPDRPLYRAFERTSLAHALSRLPDIVGTYLRELKERGRSFYNQEFDTRTRLFFKKYLPRSTLVVLMKKNSNREVIGTIRFVTLHYGIVRLTDLASGKVREILGTAEDAYAVENGVGRWQPNIKNLEGGFEITKNSHELLNQADAVINRESTVSAPESFLLPLELSSGVRVPREKDFRKIGHLVIEGRGVQVEFAHGIVKEPGLFFINKKSRSEVFQELAIWMVRANEFSTLPEFVPPTSTTYWTFNDFPLYLPFGFVHDPRVSLPNPLYQAYRGTPESLRNSVGLFQERVADSPRARSIFEMIQEFSNGDGPRPDDLR